MFDDHLTSPLKSVTNALLKAAKAAGADTADAIAIEGRSISIDVRKGGLEQAERSEGLDVGLRVFVGQRQACISSSERGDQWLSGRLWAHLAPCILCCDQWRRHRHGT
jgi:PmbA protein